MISERVEADVELENGLDMRQIAGEACISSVKSWLFQF